MFSSEPNMNMTNEKKAQRTNVTIIWFLVFAQYASLFDIFPPVIINFNFLRKKYYYWKEAYSLLVELKGKKSLTNPYLSATNEKNKGFLNTT